MKRILTLIIVGVLCLSMFSVFAPQVKAAETTILSDGFENYATNTFPSAGGWVLVYDGMGTQYQIVTGLQRYSGDKSMQLWGQSWWSARMWKGFETEANVIGYEEAIMISERNPSPEGTTCERTGFFNKDIPSWGRGWAEVRFYHSDLTIRSEGDPGTILGTWTPGTWYKVKVILDRTTNKYSVWINNQLKGSDLTLEYQGTDQINGIGLTSEHPEVKVYHDNVRVFETSALETATIDVDPGTLNLRSKGRWITSYIELTEDFDMHNINVSSILLNNTVPVASSAPTAIGDYDNDGIPDLMIKFDRVAVQSMINAAGIKDSHIALTVAGKLLDGTPFEGTDFVFIVHADGGGRRK